MKNQQLTRACGSLELRGVDLKKGTLTATVSNRQVDRYGTIFVPQGFAPWMDRYMSNPVILRNHDIEQIMGQATDFRITSDEVILDILWSQEEDAQETLRLLAGGFLRGFSQRCLVHDEVCAWDSDDAINRLPGYAQAALRAGEAMCVFTSNEMLESSVVTLPGNPTSLLRAVAEKVITKERAAQLWVDHAARNLGQPAAAGRESREQTIRDHREATTPDPAPTVEDLYRAFFDLFK